MCRLTAISAKTSLSKEAKFIFSLLVTIAERDGNGDGTGIVSFGRKAIWFKTEDTASLAITDQRWLKVLENECTTIVGHNRAASRQFAAKITCEDAHPHIKGDLVVCHNGMFDEFQKVASKFNIKPQTDSQVFAEVLHKVGSFSPEGIEKALLEMGPCTYCLLVGKGGSDKVFVVRGSGRELFWTETPYGILVHTKKENLLELEAQLTVWTSYFGCGKLLGEIHEVPEWSVMELQAGAIKQVHSLDKAQKINKRQIILAGNPLVIQAFPQKEFGEPEYNRAQEVVEVMSMLSLDLEEVEIMSIACLGQSPLEADQASWSKFIRFCEYLAEKYQVGSRSNKAAAGPEFPWFLNA